MRFPKALMVTLAVMSPSWTYASTIAADYSASAQVSLSLVSAIDLVNGLDGTSDLSLFPINAGDRDFFDSGNDENEIVQIESSTPYTSFFSWTANGFASGHRPQTTTSLGGMVPVEYRYAPSCLNSSSCTDANKLLVSIQYTIETEVFSNVYTPGAEAYVSADSGITGIGSASTTSTGTGTGTSSTTGIFTKIFSPDEYFGPALTISIQGKASYTQPEVIPLPASGLLLAFALAGFACIRARRGVSREIGV